MARLSVLQPSSSEKNCGENVGRTLQGAARSCLWESVRHYPCPFANICFDAALGLAGAFFVFDEREADVGVTVVAEADSRRHGGFGFCQQ